MNAVHPTHAARPVAERQGKEKLGVSSAEDIPAQSRAADD